LKLRSKEFLLGQAANQLLRPENTTALFYLRVVGASAPQPLSQWKPVPRSGEVSEVSSKEGGQEGRRF